MKVNVISVGEFGRVSFAIVNLLKYDDSENFTRENNMSKEDKTRICNSV